MVTAARIFLLGSILGHGGSTASQGSAVEVHAHHRLLLCACACMCVFACMCVCAYVRVCVCKSDIKVHGVRDWCCRLSKG